MIKKIKQLFCKHEDKEVFFIGVRRKNDKLVRTIFSKCQDCEKVIIYDKPKRKYVDRGKSQIRTYYGGLNPND